MSIFLTSIASLFQYEFFEVSLWRFLLAFIILVATFYVRIVVTKIFGGWLRKLVDRTRFELDNVLLDAATKPVSWGVVLSGVYLVFVALGVQERYEGLFAKVAETALAVIILVFILRLVDGIAAYLKPKVSRTETALDDAILPAMRTAAKIFVLVVGVLAILQNLDYPIASILAGLGIGGLAIALAARDTLSNWFGAFMIFTDRPFTAGDRIVIDDVDGIIEQVGLRSTKLRTLEGTLVTIPNSTIASSKINNISLRPARKVNTTIGITYSTTPEKMEEALSIIRGVLEANARVREDSIVSFEEFGAYSLDIRVLYWCLTLDYAEFLSIREEVNLEVMRRFGKAGVEMAFPTQTLYLKKE